MAWHIFQDQHFFPRWGKYLATEQNYKWVFLLHLYLHIPRDQIRLFLPFSWSFNARKRSIFTILHFDSSWRSIALYFRFRFIVVRQTLRFVGPTEYRFFGVSRHNCSPTNQGRIKILHDDASFPIHYQMHDRSTSNSWVTSVTKLTFTLL